MLGILATGFWFGDKMFYAEKGQHFGGLPFPIFYFILIFGVGFYFLMFGQFYKVYFDETTLYYSNLVKNGQFDLSNIKEVTTGSIPYKLFIFQARSITIETSDGKKIKCMSRELDFDNKTGETPETIELKLRIKQLKTKKHL